MPAANGERVHRKEPSHRRAVDTIMRFIPTIVHGLADYIVGLIVVGLPFYFGWTGTSRIAWAHLTRSVWPAGA